MSRRSRAGDLQCKCGVMRRVGKRTVTTSFIAPFRGLSATLSKAAPNGANAPSSLCATAGDYFRPKRSMVGLARFDTCGKSKIVGCHWRSHRAAKRLLENLQIRNRQCGANCDDKRADVIARHAASPFFLGLAVESMLFKRFSSALSSSAANSILGSHQDLGKRSGFGICAITSGMLMPFRR